MLDEQHIAINLADEVSGISACIKITVTDLTVILGSHGIVTLAHMDLDRDII